MKKIVCVGMLSFVLFISSAVAQDKAPTLTVEQKQAVQILALKMENAQLRVQAVQGEITTLIQSLQRDGYDLDLQTLTYKKTEPKK